MDTHELAWSAGFFDGEGTTGSCFRPEKRYRQVRLHISQVDRRNLERFKKSVGGIGYITGPIIRPGVNRKPIYIYRTDAVPDIQAVLRLLWPWLSPAKKDQATIALTRWKELGDKLNITRKRPYGIRERIRRSCEFCGKLVLFIPSRVKRGCRLFCGKSCSGKSASMIRWKGELYACKAS